MTTVSLAIDGGPKVRSTPFPVRGLFGQEEKQAVVALFDEAIASGKPIGYAGAQEEAYCREFAAFHGGGFADAVNSGTNAVYVALRALEIEPFSEIIVPPITDPGGVMPVPLINCIPIVADAAPGSYNAGAEQIAARLTERTRAIVVAHIAGIPCEMDAILELARSRGIPVVEDCAQAHGATYRGRLCGTFGEIAAFSTMYGKHHATGGQGGVVYTQSEELYRRVRQAADRGKPFGIEGATSNVLASLNFNSNEIAAAIGRVQLAKLPRILASRRRAATAIAEGCRKLHAVRMLTGPADGAPSFWFLFFQLDLARLSVDRGKFMSALRAEGVPAVAYPHCPALSDWYKNRRVFARSRQPWDNPLYKGDPNAVQAVPNVLANERCCFRTELHENYGDQEVRDILAGLAKVEAAYLKA